MTVSNTIVSIIIVNYNTVDLTRDCINSIFALTKDIAFEVILVDNSSTDGSKEFFQNDSRIKYIYSDENLGFGGGNNLGAQVASGKYLLFLNPDTVLLNNAVKMLAKFMDANPNASACGGNLYDVDGKPTLSFRRYLPGIRWELNLISAGIFDKLLFGVNSIFNHTNNHLEVGYITGADLMVPRNLFLGCNGFSKDFFMYYEETDLCFRISQCDRKIFSVPNARIMHLEGKSFSSELAQKRRNIVENGYQTYRRKNYNSIQKIVGGFIHQLYLISKNVYYSLYRR